MIDMVLIRSDGAETDCVTQWDTGITLRVSGIEPRAVYSLQYRIADGAPEQEADPVSVDRENLEIIFPIDDVTLQQSGSLEILLYEIRRKRASTLHRQVFSVSPRTKPHFYIFTPRERKNYYSLSARVTALEEFGSSTQLKDLLERVELLSAQVKEDSAETAGIADSLAAQLDELNQIISDVDNLDSLISRAVASAKLARESADSLEVMYSSMLQKNAETAAAVAQAAETLNRCNAVEQRVNVSKQAVLDTSSQISAEIDRALEQIDAAVSSSAQSAQQARLSAQQARAVGTLCTKTGCTYNKSGARTTVSYSEFGLSFSAAPKIVLNNPFSSPGAAAYVLGVTKDQFQIYLYHPSDSGQVNVTFLVGE